METETSLQEIMKLIIEDRHGHKREREIAAERVRREEEIAAKQARPEEERQALEREVQLQMDEMRSEMEKWLRRRRQWESNQRES